MEHLKGIVVHWCVALGIMIAWFGPKALCRGVGCNFVATLHILLQWLGGGGDPVQSSGLL